MILYLHGFQSSPQSYKAQLIEKRMKECGLETDYVCPQLPSSPAKSIEMSMRLVDSCPAASLTVIGSSLGGYYANWIAERLQCRAVLLNPVINPWKIKILGDNPDTSDVRVREWLEFIERYEKELHAIKVPKITYPKRYMLVAARGDALLDWRMMQDHYMGANQIIIDGSDHGLSDFDKYLEDVFSFCRIEQSGS